MDLDKEESVSERVARRIARQAEARGSSSPDGRKKPVRHTANSRVHRLLTFDTR